MDHQLEDSTIIIRHLDFANGMASIPGPAPISKTVGSGKIEKLQLSFDMGKPNYSLYHFPANY